MANFTLSGIKIGAFAELALSKISASSKKEKFGLSVHFMSTEIRGGQAAEVTVIPGKASANLPPEMRKKSPIYPRK